MSSRCLIFVPEKYASSTSPVCRGTVGFEALRLQPRRRSARVTRLCQTMALATGRPVARSQRIVVSRWFVTPMAAMSRGREPGVGDRLARRRRAATTRSPPDRARRARRREDLRELLLRRCDRRAVVAEDDRAARGRALVEGEDERLTRSRLSSCRPDAGCSIADTRSYDEVADNATDDRARRSAPTTSRCRP